MIDLVKVPMDLQLMAEGGDGGAGAAAGAEGAAADGAAEAAPDLDAEFSALIGKDGKYKEVYGKKVQAAISQRLKPARAAQDRLDSFSAGFDLLARRYGVTPNDPRLPELIAADKSLLEGVAMQNDRSTDVEFALAQAEARERAANNALRSFMIDRDAQIWQQQADDLKQAYPELDIDGMIADPKVQDLLRNPAYGGAFDFKSAARVVYGDELDRMIAESARRQAANSVASGQNRPRENGLGAGSGAANMSMDVASMPADKFRELQKRVERGERVVLG